MREEKAGKSAAKLRYRGVDIRGTRGGDGLIARLKRVERRADAADIRRTAKTEDLLDHGVHVALPGAHLVNDVAAGVLNVARGENAAAADKSEDTLVELRHGGVRTADAADRTRGERSCSSGPLKTIAPSSRHISISCIGMEEFFTPITVGTASIVRRRALFSAVPASCGML